MTKCIGITTTTYLVNNTRLPGFLVDIVEQETANTPYYEAYIWHKDFGQKRLMFGMNTDKENFLNLVKMNTKAYAALFEQEIMSD